MTLAAEHLARAERPEVGDRGEPLPSPLDAPQRHAVVATNDDDTVIAAPRPPLGHRRRADEIEARVAASDPFRLLLASN